LLAASLFACGQANDKDDVIVTDPGDDPPAEAPSTLAWKPATEGTLGGDSPSAEGSCPAGTTLVAVTTLPSGLAGEMDVCLLGTRHELEVVNLTNDNIYEIASRGGDESARGAATRTQATLVIEPGTLVLGAVSETLILGADSEATVDVPGFAIRARGTDANPVVIISPARFDAWIAGIERAPNSDD
jgi:hypothetical protein